MPFLPLPPSGLRPPLVFPEEKSGVNCLTLTPRIISVPSRNPPTVILKKCRHSFCVSVVPSLFFPLLPHLTLHGFSNPFLTACDLVFFFFRSQQSYIYLPVKHKPSTFHQVALSHHYDPGYLRSRPEDASHFSSFFSQPLPLIFLTSSFR